MKKAILLTNLIVLTFAANCFATQKKFNEDFNSLIEENLAIQKELSHELQNKFKTKDLGKSQNPDFVQVGEDVLGRGSSENIAVSEKIYVNKPKKYVKQSLEKKNFKRLSEELKEFK